MSSAENQGASSTSSSEGGLGSITSQLNSNLSFLDQYNGLSDMASVALGKAAQHQQNAAGWNVAANLTRQAAGVDWSKYFPKNPT